MTRKIESHSLDISPKRFIKIVDSFGNHLSWRDKFNDFLEAAFCAIAKLTAPSEEAADALEERYMAVIRRYEPDTDAVMRFSELLAITRMALYENPHDYLGSIYMKAEVNNRHNGQYFTPWPIAKLLTKVNFDAETVKKIIATGRPITVMDTAAGSGVMILAFADSMRSSGFDPSRHLFATTVDIDPSCVKMSFLQFAMADIPACCIVGDSLTLKVDSFAYTPAALRLISSPEVAPDLSQLRKTG